MYQRWFVRLSAVPLTIVGGLALWQGALDAEHGLSHADHWKAFGVAALVTALLVLARVRWWYVLEALVGLLAGAWCTAALLLSAWSIGNYGDSLANVDMIWISGPAIGLVASGWIIWAAVSGWRAGHAGDVASLAR